jgi:alkylhydroperoxidase/carboxymuconolactone decarboxylase family protein YurZ
VIDERSVQRGIELRSQLFDSQTVHEGSHGTAALVPELREISDAGNWGTICALEGLDMKTKSLCKITALLAGHHYDQARDHIGGAKKLGATAREVAVAIAQLTFYIGLPVVHTGLNLTAEVYGLDTTGGKAANSA